MVAAVVIYALLYVVVVTASLASSKPMQRNGRLVCGAFLNINQKLLGAMWKKDIDSDPWFH